MLKIFGNDIKTRIAHIEHDKCLFRDCKKVYIKLIDIIISTIDKEIYS